MHAHHPAVGRSPKALRPGPQTVNENGQPLQPVEGLANPLRQHDVCRPARSRSEGAGDAERVGGPAGGGQREQSDTHPGQGCPGNVEQPAGCRDGHGEGANELDGSRHAKRDAGNCLRIETPPSPQVATPRRPAAASVRPAWAVRLGLVNAHRTAAAPTRRSQVVLDGPTASSSGTDSAVPTWNDSMEPIAKAGAVATARAPGRPALERLVVGQEMIAGPGAMRPDHAGKKNSSPGLGARMLVRQGSFAGQGGCD